MFYTITRQKNDREIAFEDSPRTDCFTLIPHCIADRVIDSHIKNLRRKISDAAETGNRHEWVQAVYGVGYRFEYPED